MKLKTLLNEIKYDVIQNIIDNNQYVSGIANKESIIEVDDYFIFLSPDGLKHIKERHSNPNKPGSIITGDVKDLITKTVQNQPSEVSNGRVKWLEIKVGPVGEMGVVLGNPEEVSKMKDYIMPDGKKEKVKIAPGKRPKTDLFNVITAQIGKVDKKPLLSIITAFPGSMSINGKEIPLDRNKFTENGFYFVVDKI